MIERSFGKYKVTARLGSGGMAEVYQARDAVLDRDVAIKVILPHLNADADFAERFLREARLVASLRHPNIVQIFDFDLLDGMPFMVMECLTGGTLRSRLAALRGQGRLMSPGAIAHLLDGLCSALDFAHAQGAVHRDIKPANILFSGSGEAVLTDFGIARLLDQASQISATGSILGTPAYMSPEQAAGKAVDRRSDLYSLGVVVYELTTGRTPFQAETPATLLLQHMSVEPPDPRSLNQNLPTPLAQVILQMLRKDPADRFPSASAFARAFRAALTGQPVAITSADDATVITGGDNTSTPASGHVVPRTEAPPSQNQEATSVTATIGTGFVARERELDQLQAFLSKAWAGQGQICFIAGEAGVGKTALVTEFARRAQTAYPALIVAGGICNAHSGAGDPFLPFRETLSTLVGLTAMNATAETTALRTGAQTAQEVTQFAQALTTHGPDLIDLFVPGESLLKRLAERSVAQGDWVTRLEGLVQRQIQPATGQNDAKPSHLFEQYTNVLKAVAAQRPLLLLLDDLQWIDVASADLLFHLSRRIRQDRILILGTLRADEVQMGRSGAPHPLAKVLAELKRAFGDIEITLESSDPDGGRHFVAALLDQFPNRLGTSFRQALFHHTAGHALFTVELVHHLQEQGDLLQDETGHWVAQPTLDWRQLPPRVEGVIEERIGRLSEELRDVLTIASVEGENFTAEVVARVRSLDARTLVRQLSQELERRHRLVGTVGRQRVGGQHLSLFRFQHNLFQKYLYLNLNEVERAYFHEDVGTVLEALYGDNTDAIAVQLVWHFTEADLPERALRYLAIAGEQARRRYAHQEALSYLQRALELTPEADDAGRYALLLACEKVYEVLADREAQRRYLIQLDELAHRFGDRQRQAEIALRQTLYASHVNQHNEAIEHAQRAIELATSLPNVEQEAIGYLLWGRALSYLSEYQQSLPKLRRALALAAAEQLQQTKADTLRALGVVAYFLGDYTQAIVNYEQTLVLYREMSDRRNEGHALSNLGLALRELGKYDAAYQAFEQALHLSQESGDRDRTAHVLINLGLLMRDMGKYTASRNFYEQSIEICRQTGAEDIEANALLGIGDIHKDQSEFPAAATYYADALRIFARIGDRRLEHLALKDLGNTALELGNYIQARTCYESALFCFRQIGDRQSESSTLNRLSLLYYQLNDAEAARTNGEASLSIAQEIGDKWLTSSSLAKLGHSLARLEQWDKAADCYRQAVSLWREQGRPDLALESVAGLARIALARGDLRQAQAYAEELINEFEDDTFPNDGMAEEFLTCYRALQANADSRAAHVLSTIYHQLQTTAAKIDDEEMRRIFLENVPTNREVVQEYSVARAVSHSGSSGLA